LRVEFGRPLPYHVAVETSASLLERLRTAPDEAAWRRPDDLYRPLVRRWLLRDPSLGDDAEDLVHGTDRLQAPAER
jgi:hypothetical protein